MKLHYLIDHDAWKVQWDRLTFPIGRMKKSPKMRVSADPNMRAQLNANVQRFVSAVLGRLR